jgi:hypothetical protein
MRPFLMGVAFKDYVTPNCCIDIGNSDSIDMGGFFGFQIVIVS